jgi:alpha-galactosidase
MPEGYTDWIVDYDATEKEISARMEAYASGDGPLDAEELEQFMVERGHKWQTLDIILSLLDNGNRYVLALNVPNDGYINNLRRDAIVEVPAIVGTDRIYGLGVRDLPPAIAALLELQLGIMDLNVEAAVTGDRQTALEALMIDPCVPDPATAEKVLEEMLLAQADLLPQFG